jgi:S-sulfo-L-cysteine synthase (3-phospho-L-serine-dependent)
VNGCLVAIESNTSGTGRLFAWTAENEGYHSITLASDPSRYAYLSDDGLDFIQTDTTDLSAVEGVLDELERSSGVAGVYSSSEYFIETAARVASRRGLPAADPEAIATCRNKACQRLLLQRSGAAIPSFAIAHSVEEATQALDRVTLPVVLKPVFGTGSVGVSLCRTATELQLRAEELLSQTKNERGMPVPGQVLIEQLVEGPEFSVEVFGHTVIGITRKYVSPPPYFVEIGHDFPAAMASEQDRAIRETALSALGSVGLNWGPAHVELRIGPHGPAIIEINPRLAGGFIPELVRAAYGVDLIRETLRTAAGQATDVSSQWSRYASIRFLTVSNNGVFEGIEGVEEARSVPGVSEVLVYRNPGESVFVRNDFRDRIGHVITSAQNAAGAIHSAEESLEAIRIHVRPEGN